VCNSSLTDEPLLINFTQFRVVVYRITLDCKMTWEIIQGKITICLWRGYPVILLTVLV